MDPSPVPASEFNSSVSGSDSGDSPIPSVGNKPPEMTSQGGDSSSSKRKRSSSEDVDITGISSPGKRTESSTGRKETGEEEEDTAGNTSRGGWPNAEELSLLSEIRNYRCKYGSYPFDDEDKLKELFEKYVKRRTGVYANYVEMNKKIDELLLKFLVNRDKKSKGEDVEAAMSSPDRETFFLSCTIWGEVDEFKFKPDNGSDSKSEKESSQQETKDSSEQESSQNRDSSSKSDKESSEQETKDSSEQESSQNRDSSSKSDKESSEQETKDSSEQECSQNRDSSSKSEKESSEQESSDAKNSSSKGDEDGSSDS